MNKKIKFLCVVLIIISLVNCTEEKINLDINFKEEDAAKWLNQTKEIIYENK